MSNYKLNRPPPPLPRSDIRLCTIVGADTTEPLGTINRFLAATSAAPSLFYSFSL